MQKKSYSLQDLIDVTEKLRDPVDGCPWDLEQTPKSIRGHMIEEVHELIEAIELENEELICEEMGDILFHLVFHATMAKERKAFTMQDVINGATQKMIHRHPHVFSNNTAIKSSQDVIINWEIIKKEEKKKERKSVLDGIPKGIPSLIKAYKLQTKAANIGFDFENYEQVHNKLLEEFEELEQSIKNFRIIHEKQDKTKGINNIEEELGDVLFSLVNLARFLDINPEVALNHSNNKFKTRFEYIEQFAKDHSLEIEKLSLQQMDKLWNEAKIEENT